MALYIPLFVMSALQLGVSNVATELAYINPSITLICTVVAAFLNLLLSNVAFSFFAVDRSKETLQPARTPSVYLLASTVPLQISGALLIYLVHLILSAIVVFASLASSQLGVLCSLVVAVIVTLLSASFVFVLIEDADVGQRGLRGIRFAPRYVMCSITALRSSCREIARPAMLLVTWNLVASCAIPVLVGWVVSSAALPSALSVTSLVHEGLYYGAFAYMLLLLVHCAVASWLEIDVLMGVSLCVSEQAR